MKKLREMFPDGMYTDNSEGVFKRFKELLENDYRASDESNYDSSNFCGLDPYYDLDLVQYDYVESYENLSVYLTNKEFFQISLDEKLIIGDTPQQLKEGVESDIQQKVQLGNHYKIVDDGSLIYGHGESGECVGYFEDCAIIRMSYGLGCFESRCLSPLLTERELFIQQGIDDLSGLNPYNSLGGMLGKLFDKGYTKGETK